MRNQKVIHPLKVRVKVVFAAKKNAFSQVFLREIFQVIASIVKDEVLVQ